MNFRKIKTNGVKVELEWTTEVGSDETEHRLTSFAEPHPDLVSALAAFVPIVIRLLGVHPEWSEGLTVSSISINTEDDGRIGCVVTCLRTLPLCNAPLVINTPHLREPREDAEDGRRGFFVEGMAEAIDEAQTQAAAYLKGKRAQTEMFAGSK